jgi:uncharacterized membrane protein YhaH (DUF805 family)
MNFANVLFSFSGRINRAKLWLAVVFWLVVWVIAFVVLMILLGRSIAEFNPDDVGSIIAALGTGILVILVVVIPMFISNFAVGIKRLHDRDKSGWWIVLFYFGPLVLDAIGNSIEGPASFLLSLAGFAIAIWGLIELGFLKGTTGPNQYGPDPLPPHQPAPTLPAAMH